MKRRLQILPISIFTALFLLLSRYVLAGLETLGHQSYISLVFWSVVTFSVLLLLYAIWQMQSGKLDLFFKIASHIFLILFASELLFASILLSNDIYRGLYGLVNLIAGHQFLVPDRSLWWVGFGALSSGILILLFLYGILKGKYAYRVIQHTLYFKDLPDAFNGFTITQISDVHAGSLKNPKAVQRGIDLIQKQQSDLFVFTGDLVNNKATEIEPWLGHFSQIKAPYGQFSILGNHDYGDYVKWKDEATKTANLQLLKTYHADLGFRLLLDEHVRIEKDGQQLVLAGVENWGLGFGERGDLQKALNHTQAEEFKILLSHDPSHWEAQVKNNTSKIHLTLAGHTHGMQFGIEAFGIKWSPVKYRYPHWAGILASNERILNINRGFGFIGFSGRVGIWPEITVITLRQE